MSDTEEVETTETDDTTTDVEVTEEQAEDPTEGLRKALAAERKLRKEKERELRTAIQERETANLEPDEKALAEARREAAAEATSAANKRILRTELRAIAKGRLADPADALLYLDPDEFVGDDGEPDTEAIEEAISDLLTKRPYLGVDTGQKFRGSADQGAKGKSGKPLQMTHEEVKKLSAEGRHDEIVAAEREGRLDDLMNR